MYIRFATNEDIQAILVMEKQCFENKAWSLDMIQNDFNNRSKYIVCLTDADEYIGYACVLDLDNECEVLRLGVVKQFRKQGFGWALMDFVQEYCIETHKEKIFLEVNSKNNTAIRLYEKFGFTRINSRANYYGEGEHAQIYTKLL